MLSTPESEINKAMNKSRPSIAVALPGLLLAAFPLIIVLLGTRLMSLALAVPELLIAGSLGVAVLGWDKFSGRSSQDREAAPFVLLVLIAITVAVLLYVVRTMMG